MTDKEEMLAYVQEAMTDITKAIDENHVTGFLLVNTHKRLSLIEAKLLGKPSSEISEFHTKINQKPDRN